MGPGMMTSVRLHQAMLAAALIVPSSLFLAAGWANRRDVEREGRDAIQRTAAVMQEQALKVFETASLAVGWVDDRIDDEDWPTISSPATSEFLRRMRAPLAQIVSIWIADADGVVRAGSEPWPAGSGIAGRDFFQVHKAGPRERYISPPFTGRATSKPSFAISIRRTTPDQRFDGTIHAALSPAYFSRFFAEAAPGLPHVAVLLEDDGTVLAREPEGRPTDPAVLGGDAPLMQAIARGPGNGFYVNLAGMAQEYAARRVGPYPAWVVFEVPRAAMLGRWYRNLAVYGAVAAAAALTLLGVSFLALRRAEAEQAALVRLEIESGQRQAAELQLRHAQRMDAVGQLTGGIAHDFNNLLTAILGNLELIQRAALQAEAAGPGDAGPRIERLAATAMRAVQRGASLTKSLLAFSRKQPLQARMLDVNTLLDGFADLLRQAAGPGVEATIERAPALPECIADAAELEAALLNLVINARDAMHGRGQLRIGTAMTYLDTAALGDNQEARPGPFVAIQVADDGTGMAPEVAEKAFEPFFTTKPAGQGTGLGLSQVFGFVRQLGGHVTLASTPGKGTAITLFLPVAAEAETADVAV